MPTTRKPSSGTMQFWPRKRAKRDVARIRSWANIKDAKLLGFAGYKAGMTHLMIIDNKAKSPTKGQEIAVPATVIECPPIKVASVRFYKKNNGYHLVGEVLANNFDKELARKIPLPKKVAKKIEDIKDFDEVRLVVYTQPKLTGIGKKKPEIIEIAIGGSKDEQLAYAKEKLGKEIYVKDVFSEGQQVDTHAITKGKGYQGPIKRFGISKKSHKTEKGVRTPGSLGGWCGQGHFMWRIAHAGQMGYHQRTEYNKWVIKIGDKPNEINPSGGFVHYGIIRNQYIILKGSVAGPPKRLIQLTYPIRPNKKIPTEAPTISYINLESKQ